MALTTETSQQYSVPSGPPRQISQEAAILLDKSIVARPLSAPEVASIHVKNTEYYYRWVNRLHSHGQVYMRYKAMGFSNATKDDVEVLVGDTAVSDDEIRCGDVILMKIQFAHWASHAKRNMQVAETLQRTRGVHTTSEEVSSDVFAEGGRPRHSTVNDDFKGLKGKVSSFIPDNPDALIDGQSAPDTEKARDTVAQIRSKHAAERSK